MYVIEEVERSGIVSILYFLYRRIMDYCFFQANQLTAGSEQ